MKAEHRKELETNALARYLGTALQQAKEGPSQKVLLYGGILVLVILVIAVFLYFSGRTKDTDSLRWEQWFAEPRASLTADEKEQMAKEYPGTSEQIRESLYELQRFSAANPGTAQARLARFQEARLLMQQSADLGSLARGIREDARVCVGKGRDLYEKLIDESGDVPYLAQEALFNAAKGNEDLEEFDKAKKYYTRLKKDYPKSLYFAEADKALKRLDDENDLEMLKKLAATD